MLRYKTQDVTAAANTEAGLVFLTVPTDRTYHLRSLMAEGADADTDIRLYVEQNRVVDISAEALFDAETPVPLDWRLPGGTELACQINNKTGGSVTRKVTLGYDDDPGV